MFADKYFLFPVVMIALIGGLVLLMKWISPGTKQSLVRRVDTVPASRDAFGVLVEVRRATTRTEASRIMKLLTGSAIRSTIGRTTVGWSVYVWPTDEAAARTLLNLK